MTYAVSRNARATAAVTGLGSLGLAIACLTSAPTAKSDVDEFIDPSITSSVDGDFNNDSDPDLDIHSSVVELGDHSAVIDAAVDVSSLAITLDDLTNNSDYHPNAGSAEADYVGTFASDSGEPGPAASYTSDGKLIGDNGSIYDRTQGYDSGNPFLDIFQYFFSFISNLFQSIMSLFGFGR
ncbi:hypothetical protein [Mycolicibacter icosiumassiliensis]|uniref:hypothetical protein n=1 Tax=Mycolicibacter icosiumassiliensis TaxID=1792835 RepID=UPI0012B6A101|nr:hypothetical protein [Mycolicibacter icosiumassiliensis]